jgi:hypothetical protein
MTKQGLRGANVMFLCTAGGTFLGAYRNGDLETPLAAWGRLPAAEREAGGSVEPRGERANDIWCPELPTGGLIVKTYTRALKRDDKSKLYAPRTLSLGVSRTVIAAEPNRDFLWLTKQEWQSLVPQRPEVGHAVTVPRAVRDRIFRFHLVDGACCLPGFWPRDARLGGELTLTVEDVSPSMLRLAVHGKARVGKGDRQGAFTLGGVLAFDRTRDAFIRFDLVALSDKPCHKDTATGEMLPLGIAFALGRDDHPADRRPPFRLWEVNSTNDYFAD